MCDTLHSPQEILRRGEGAIVFAHSGACRTCRNALLEQGAYPPGCVEPWAGHQVILTLDQLADGVGGDRETLEHLRRCAACALEVEEARAALDELPAPNSNVRVRWFDGHPGHPGHPRISRWLMGGLLLVIGATASEPSPRRLLEPVSPGYEVPNQARRPA
jgi:hypothetical protein